MDEQLHHIGLRGGRDSIARIQSLQLVLTSRRRNRCRSRAPAIAAVATVTPSTWKTTLPEGFAEPVLAIFAVASTGEA